MRTTEVIEQMLVILNHPGRWKPGAMARDSESHDPYSRECDPLSTMAMCWSVEGACLRASNGDPSHWLKVKKIILQFRPPLGSNGETVTHEAVRSLISAAYHYAYLQEMSDK